MSTETSFRCNRFNSAEGSQIYRELLCRSGPSYLCIKTKSPRFEYVLAAFPLLTEATLTRIVFSPAEAYIMLEQYFVFVIEIGQVEGSTCGNSYRSGSQRRTFIRHNMPLNIDSCSKMCRPNKHLSRKGSHRMA